MKRILLHVLLALIPVISQAAPTKPDCRHSQHPSNKKPTLGGLAKGVLDLNFSAPGETAPARSRPIRTKVAGMVTGVSLTTITANVAMALAAVSAGVDRAAIVDWG